MLTETELRRLRRQEFWSHLLAYPTYAFIVLLARLKFRYRFQDLRRSREEVWSKLETHDGPVLWAANHLTMIDSFLLFWAVVPWRRVAGSRWLPWSTPEFRNYHRTGGWLKGPALRTLMYLCRAIPFLREGDDAVATRWRDAAFQKCVRILREGGSVFVYPEAGRSRSGWLDPNRPKDFLGRLALAAPGAKFLCLYFRGEHQAFATVAPRRREVFRLYADVVEAVEPGETTPRSVSERLFQVLGRLQERWFAGSALPKNCGGNDVVDLASPLHRERIDPETGEADPEWLERHLTEKERAYLEGQPPALRYAVFWKLFAAKEAAHKALAQGGVSTPIGAFPMLEVDLFRRKVVHRPTCTEVQVAFTDDDGEKVHCVAVLRGGSVGDEGTPGDVIWRVEKVPDGEAPGEFARGMLLDLIAESADDIPSPAVLALTEVDGIPRVLRGGRVRDWGVSLSHSGRFAACSFMIS